MTFDVFLEAAWRDHGDQPEEVARRLEAGYALIETPAQVAALARILAHVDGEHCARWRDGVARRVRLRGHRLWNEDSDAPVVVRRLIAALDLADGGKAEPGLDDADRAHATVGDTVGSARARRAALGYHATLADDQKPWCESTLRRLA